MLLGKDESDIFDLDCFVREEFEEEFEEELGGRSSDAFDSLLQGSAETSFHTPANGEPPGPGQTMRNNGEESTLESSGQEEPSYLSEFRRGFLL